MRAAPQGPSAERRIGTDRKGVRGRVAHMPWRVGGLFGRGKRIEETREGERLTRMIMARLKVAEG